ncbi:unnamed protein product [Polarella glacialis]|uniref:Lipoxygenase domain-containing protein n=1 Tax=Polarella glacialis TaxID=89957 RepID=A0A813KSQ7_POLGL|nr:unnamed protein product [Polarella glacialis]
MIAFNLIGAHRIEATHMEFKGETLEFVIRLNKFHGIETRPYFARYGGDLYFNADGLPIMLKTPSGTQVQRGDKDWQYWKFAWRSALITIITLVDHLHLAHFRVANVLTTAVRKTLSPKHPLRRFFSVFTFGSVFVNMNAMHTLIGKKHVLHRSSPFKEFEALSSLVPEMLPQPTEQHKSLVNDEAFARLPKMIQDAPYFQDGRLLVGALRKHVVRFTGIYHRDICSTDNIVTDPEVKRFLSELVAENAQAHYATPLTEETKCSDMFEILLSYIWTVTGWHRHVGTVGDYFADPDLASFSWKEGEAYARPLAHPQLLLLCYSTTTITTTITTTTTTKTTTTTTITTITTTITKTTTTTTTVVSCCLQHGCCSTAVMFQKRSFEHALAAIKPQQQQQQQHQQQHQQQEQ